MSGVGGPKKQVAFANQDDRGGGSEKLDTGPGYGR